MGLGVIPFVVAMVLSVVLLGIVAVALYSPGSHSRLVGEYKAVGVVVEDVEGQVNVVTSNVSGVVVKSNLPVKAEVKAGILHIHCPRSGLLSRLGGDCRGDVFVEVNESITGVEVKGVKGEVHLTVPCDVDVEYISGSVEIDLPDDRSVEVTSADVSGEVKNEHTGKGPTVRVNLFKVHGDAVIR